MLDPCSVAFGQHIQIDENGRITARTSQGQAHIDVPRLDDPRLTEYRGRVIATVRSLEEDGSEDALVLLQRWLGFPDDLPDLAVMRPPGGNTKPNSARSCYYEQRKAGTLPVTY